MEFEEYYLGLDLGTDSVGWAVTDKNYQLLRYKGKDLWGIREFEEASTKAERRQYRSAKRRRQREVARIGLLKELFHDELVKVDPSFLIRLDNSYYHLEDKEDSVKTKYSIFNDENYTDKDYYKDYPTIFHLRRELINNKNAHDVRLVYLAILNIFKHRGHFLNSGELDNLSTIDLYHEMMNLIKDNLNISIDSNINLKDVFDDLSSHETSRTRKKEQLIELYQIGKKDKKHIEIVKAICGLKVNALNLFDNLQVEKGEKIEFDFSSFSFEDKIPELISLVGEENYEIIASMKRFYDSVILSKTLNGKDYISEARCESYEKHASDLRKLKNLYKLYLEKEDYNRMFRSQLDGTYSAYVNTVNSVNIDNQGKTKSRRDFKEKKVENLYQTIKKDLEKIDNDNEDKQYILSEIEKENFLPKQLTASNGVIPNQTHKKELVAILNNAEKYLPFLLEKDETNLTVSEKIIQLFEFQIPYYVGPLGKNSKTGWAIREEGKILPWNFNEKVNTKETSQRFIERMVRHCTYITQEKVRALPKNSLMYEIYCVLNEINNIKINGEKIPSHLKQELYQEIYLKHKKVTRKQINDFFINRGLVQDASEISGIDVNINNQLSTYHKFKPILGEKINEDQYRHLIEDVVFWITVYGDKKLVKEEIQKKYSDLLSANEIKRILGLRFKDWGNLSKEFLELQGINKQTGEFYSIIRMLWETNDNLMQLLSEDKYTYMEQLNQMNHNAYKSLAEITYEDLDDSYYSMPVKRMIWQTLLIIKELEKVLGKAPSRIFVEMIRKHEEKNNRKTSRKQKFLDLYKNVHDETKDWKEIINDADKTGKLKTKKMYLYLTQRGQCMYTGETIELDDLFNNNLYDIDHIYPRHFVKDDNINNNLVLVKKEKNNHKSDTFPIEQGIKNKCHQLWKELLDAGLIEKEKYDRLTSRQALSDDQKASFIARQLVETGQGTKGTAGILNNIMPKDTEIVYAKGSNVSDFRHEFKIPKSRIVNDYHHAHDAYLNIVVGNVYYTKFTKSPRNFIEKEYNKDENRYHYNLDKMYKWDVVRNNQVAWKAPIKDGDQGTISIVKETLKRNTPLLTRMSVTRSGQLSNQQLTPAEKVKKSNATYFPIKTSDPRMSDVTKYGGKSDISTGYFFLVAHTKGKKRIRTIETVPVYLKDKIEENVNLKKYCEEQLQLKDVAILISRINVQSLIKYNGYYLHITGKTGNRLTVRNAVNLALSNYWINYIHKIEKYVESSNMDTIINVEDNIKLYDILLSKHLDTIYAKRPNPVGEKLETGRSHFLKLDINNQISVLYQILQLSEIGLETANLKLIGESANTGKMLINKEITKANECILIHQSVTGIFEKRINLLSDELENSCCIK